MTSSGPNTDYPLGVSDSEIEHLLTQAHACAPASRALLDRIQVASDWRALDAGCGALGILDLLAERIGASGSVMGLDREETMLKIAREQLDRSSLQRVQLVHAAIDDSGLEPGSLDLAHTRMVLVHLPDVRVAVAHLATLVRDGGVVALEEPDVTAWICEPSNAAWERGVQLFNASLAARGCDVQIGRRLAGLLHAAGVGELEIDVPAMWITRPGVWAHTQLPSFLLQVRETLIEADMATSDELDALDVGLRAHLAGPDTVTYCPMWQAWGRHSPSDSST